MALNTGPFGDQTTFDNLTTPVFRSLLPYFDLLDYWVLKRPGFKMVYCSFFVGLLQLLPRLDRKSPSPTRPFPKNRITRNEIAAKTIPKIILPKVQNGDTGQAKLNPTKIILRKKFEKVRKTLKRKTRPKFLRKNEKQISEKVISKMKASQKRLAAVVISELVK